MNVVQTDASFDAFAELRKYRLHSARVMYAIGHMHADDTMRVLYVE